MRHAILTLEVEPETEKCYVILRHAPGCEHEHDHTDKVFTIPPAAAVAMMEGTGRIIQMAGTPVPQLDKAPEVPRPKELDDPDRKNNG